MNDLVSNLPAIGSVPLVLAGLVVIAIVRKIVMGVLLLGAGIGLAALAVVVSQR